MANDNDAKQADKKEPSPPVNLGEATGRAIFQSADDSKINKPQKGEAKRSLRLLRLIFVFIIALLSLVVVLGFVRRSLPGFIKIIGILVFLVLSSRCFLVAYQLWKKLK